jgi:hypothetical protein
MRKIFLVAALATSLATSALASNDTRVDYTIQQSFRNQFSNAKNVEWSKTGSYVKATFILGKLSTEAFFSNDGDLIGTSHAINLEELPTGAKRTYAQKYSDYTVKEAILFEGMDESAYFISAQKEETNVILKVVGNRISVYKPATESMIGKTSGK